MISLLKAKTVVFVFFSLILHFSLSSFLQFAVLMWILTYVGALFNGLTLLILGKELSNVEKLISLLDKHVLHPSVDLSRSTHNESADIFITGKIDKANLNLFNFEKSVW